MPRRKAAEAPDTFIAGVEHAAKVARRFAGKQDMYDRREAGRLIAEELEAEVADANAPDEGDNEASERDGDKEK